MVKFSYDLGAWLVPGGFEESTLREAIDIIRHDMASGSTEGEKS